MRRLILLFIKNGGVILFLLLEGICMFLVINFNKEQREIYLSSSNRVSGLLYESVDGATRFWNLNNVNDSIAQENASLRKEVDLLRQLVKANPNVDTSNAPPGFTYIPAKVLNNSIDKHNNSFTINRGEKHGVEPGMGVLSEKGVVGIVRSVGNGYATVMSILHKQSRISAELHRYGFFGFLTWPIDDPTRAIMVDVPKHAPVSIGDTIVTSGYSYKFPQGLMLGVVDTFFIQPGSNFYTIDVLLSVDMSSLKYVYVADEKEFAEVKKIEEEADE